MGQKSRVFLFGKEFEAEEYPSADVALTSYQGWLVSPQGYLYKDFELFNNKLIKFIIERKQKDLCLSFFGLKSFFMARPFFSIDNRNDDPVSKYKFGLIRTFGRPRKIGTINDSFEDWPANFASKFLTTSINTLSDIADQYQYGHIPRTAYENMSSFAYQICRNLEWPNLTIQNFATERILDLIVKASIEECAWTFSRTGSFNFRTDFKTMGFDSVKLGAHILATGKLPIAPLKHFQKDSGIDLCLENQS